MKGSYYVEEFLNHIARIYFHSISNEEIQENVEGPVENIASESSYIRPRKILEMYIKGKISDYINLCKKDGRSASFIEKLQKIENEKMGDRDFIQYLRNALRTEANFHSITIKSERRRISTKELFGYLENNKISEFKTLYQSVHGKWEGFHEDIDTLHKGWKSLTDTDKQKSLDKVLLKYQNLRNRKHTSQ